MSVVMIECENCGVEFPDEEMEVVCVKCGFELCPYCSGKDVIECDCVGTCDVCGDLVEHTTCHTCGMRLCSSCDDDTDCRACRGEEDE